MNLRRAVALCAFVLAVVGGTASAQEAAPPDETAAGSTVQVVGDQGAYLYLVDGIPEPVRGMGYNAILGGRPEDERQALLSRDFALMKRVGVNTVIGWDQAHFDRALLDTAQASGLGVVMHFELAKGLDYADPALRARLLGEIEAWVLAHRDHPSVRMWGVGNEVLLTTSDDECRAFAEFFVQAYQVVRKLDPHHPVVYREAEDVRVPFFRDAFADAGVQPDGFVFGMNFYTPRIEEALGYWHEYGFDVPVLISEFAPAGIAPSTRAEAFRDMWTRVRQHEKLVLGAAPYTWTTEGPEAVDKIFGLTDGNGHPVDDSLVELQRLYRGAAAKAELLPDPVARERSTLDLSLETAVAQSLARALALPDLDPIDVPAVRQAAREHYRAELASAPGFDKADPARMERMLDILSDTAVLAGLRRAEAPVYSGAVEALPLLAGMARWAALDPEAEVVAASFIGEVLAQALRSPVA